MTEMISGRYLSPTRATPIPIQRKRIISSAWERSSVATKDWVHIHISPTLFKAREVDDLFRWWKATEIANQIGFDENSQALYHKGIETAEGFENEEGEK